MARERGEFTETQEKILAVLSDGLAHTKEELRQCLPDELGSISNIKAHLTGIRKKIRKDAHDVLCEYVKGRLHYRLVRLIGSSNE